MCQTVALRGRGGGRVWRNASAVTALLPRPRRLCPVRRACRSSCRRSLDEPRRARRTLHSRASSSICTPDRCEQVRQHVPTRPREARRGFGLQESLHSSAKIRERPFLFGEVRDRQHDRRGVPRPCGERRADHDDRARFRDVRCVDSGKLFVGDDQHVAGAHRRQRRVAPREAEQFRAANVGGAILSQREIFDAGERRFVALLDAERSRAAVLLQRARRAGTTPRSTASATRGRTPSFPRAAARLPTTAICQSVPASVAPWRTIGTSTRSCRFIQR